MEDHPREVMPTVPWLILVRCACNTSSSVSAEPSSNLILFRFFTYPRKKKSLHTFIVVHTYLHCYGDWWKHYKSPSSAHVGLSITNSVPRHLAFVHIVFTFDFKSKCHRRNKLAADKQVNNVQSFFFVKYDLLLIL